MSRLRMPAAKLTRIERAQLRDAVARARLGADPKVREGLERGDVLRLAARLLPHVCEDSDVDREAHAVAVARMILNARRR